MDFWGLIHKNQKVQNAGFQAEPGKRLIARDIDCHRNMFVISCGMLTFSHNLHERLRFLGFLCVSNLE